MTEPTITYGHGILYDFDNVTAWTKHEDGQTSTFAVDNEDAVKINVTNSAGNKTVYIDAAAGDITSTLFTKILYRYKTSSSTIKAKIEIEFGIGTQTILAESSNTAWTVGSATITTAKTIHKIRLYANQDVGDVYYDFVLVYKDDFTFPNAESILVTPRTALGRIAAPNRWGRIPQTLGGDDTQVIIDCDLDVGDWTRILDTIEGQVFFEIAHESNSENWQWLNTGQGHKFKVRLETPNFQYVNDMHLLTLTFYEYRLGDASDETYEERFGI